MRPLVAALVLVAFAACEKKLSEEEIEAQQQLEQQKQAEAAKKASPSPKPGDWMWKSYKNPLEKR